MFEIMSEGFYNLNAGFLNDVGDRDLIGTWNFHAQKYKKTEPISP